MHKNETIGRIGENMAINELLERKYKIEVNIYLDRQHDYDLLVNDKKIEVKTSRISNSGRWLFNYAKNLDKYGNKKFDILFAIGLNEDKKYFFIIPANKIPKKGIQIRPFSKCKSWKKYEQYLNNWEII